MVKELFEVCCASAVQLFQNCF